MSSFYTGKQAVLATKHAKEKIIARPFRIGLGLNIVVPANLDTDSLGTFSGEIPRIGTVEETVLEKARLGLSKTSCALAIASEGSFGPHPNNPFMASDYEIMIFLDKERDFYVTESVLSYKTNYNQIEVASHQDAETFLIQAGFPKHAVIVRPKGVKDVAYIYKGITSNEELNKAISNCVKQSPHGMAQLETDMRSYLNPTRREIIRQLTFKLVRRLREQCRECHLPGWGLIAIEKGLPCEACATPTELTKAEIHGCVKCGYQTKQTRADGKKFADIRYCQHCNP